MNIAIFTTVEVSSEALARSARRAGHEVLMGHFTSDKDRQWLLESDALVVRFSSRTYDKACDIARWYHENNPRGVLVPSEKAIRSSADKYETYKILHEHSIKTPPTYLLNTIDDIAIHRLREKLPLIIKPRNENRGIGISVARNESELHDQCAALIATYGSCIAQDFIVEAGGKDVRAFVIDDNVVAAMERSAPKGSDIANLSQGGSARPFAIDAPASQLAIAAAKTCGTKIAGVDLLKTAHGMTVLEVNASPGVKVAAVTGIDVCGRVIQYIADERTKND
jgi:ribosomal protein S6--L-glutamate ligase